MKEAVAFGFLFRLAGPVLRKVLDGVVWTVGYQITSRAWDAAGSIKLPLLRPRVTMASLIAGLSALGGMCLTTVGGLAPLADKHGLELLRPWILGIDTALGIIAGLCITFCAIGRSISHGVDHAQLSATPKPPATAALALPEEAMGNVWEQLLGKGLDVVAADAEANKATILQWINTKGLTIENAAETFVDAEISKAPLTGVLSFVPRALLVQGVNKGIQDLIAAGQSREDVLFDLVVGKIQTEAKALGG